MAVHLCKMFPRPHQALAALKIGNSLLCTHISSEN